MWAANRANVSNPALQRIEGDCVSPKIAGSNKYRDITVASVAYSAKPENTEIGLFRTFDITPNQITRAREYEDLIQILFRTSLRVPDDTRPIEWNVYDRKQAEFLASYLVDNGFPVTVHLEYRDIGIDVPARNRSIRAELRTADEREALIARARENATERKRRLRAEARAALGDEAPPRGRKKCPIRQQKLADQAARRAERQARKAASTKPTVPGR